MSFKITSSSRVVVLTGAGISAESGLKTFRDNNGLWENHAVEDVATPEAFSRTPDLVYRFYNQRRLQLSDVNIRPNAGHFALAKLEALLKDNFLLVTQNVDDLHERAGSERIIHMHGELLSYRCTVSRKVSVTKGEYDGSHTCKCCVPGNPIRPNIVWFGEMPMKMDEITTAIEQADVFISIGTSGNVYPAAGFVNQANFAGVHTIELNLEPSASHTVFSETFYGKGTQIVPEFFEERLVP